MLDNKLYKTQEWEQILQLPDGSQVSVKKIEIRTLLTEREFLPIFERPSVDGKRGRRIIVPLFGYDPNTKFVIGEEGATTTLNERMIAVIMATRQAGFDDIHPDDIASSPGAYVHFHFFFSGSESHGMCFIPDFDEMEWKFMVRAEIVDVSR